jgi:hypothetical protein
MRTIYKYELPVTDEQVLHIPDKFKVLSSRLIKGTIFLWIEVNLAQQLVPTTFYVKGTGHEIKDRWKLQYDGTVHAEDGYPFVWHIFHHKTFASRSV